jgi:hypothetical protein
LTVYALDAWDCISPAAAFKGIVVEGSDRNGASVLEYEHSIRILPRETAPRSVETDFYCVSYYHHYYPERGNFNFIQLFGNSCAQSNRR